MASEISIKGMVCERCISVIREGITKLGYEVDKVSLGKLSLKSEIGKDGVNRIDQFLNENGFELISNRQVRLVSQAKELINEVFGQNVKYDAKLKFSTLLSEKLHMNYDSISEAFTRKIYYYKTPRKSKGASRLHRTHSNRDCVHHGL